jgi:hypothetical protein
MGVVYVITDKLCRIIVKVNVQLTLGYLDNSQQDKRVSLVEQELLILLEHLSSPTVFCGVRVTRSFVVCVCIVDRCLSFCPFSFGHCVVCSSSIYGLWLPLWYLQTFLAHVMCLLQLLLYHLLYFILVYFCSECFLHIPLLNAVNLYGFIKWWMRQTKRTFICMNNLADIIYTVYLYLLHKFFQYQEIKYIYKQGNKL